jgi:hypothetical protein
VFRLLLFDLGLCFNGDDVEVNRELPERRDSLLDGDELAVVLEKGTEAARIRC